MFQVPRVPTIRTARPTVDNNYEQFFNSRQQSYFRQQNGNSGTDGRRPAGNSGTDGRRSGNREQTRVSYNGPQVPGRYESRYRYPSSRGSFTSLARDRSSPRGRLSSSRDRLSSSRDRYPSRGMSESYVRNRSPSIQQRRYDRPRFSIGFYSGGGGR